MIANDAEGGAPSEAVLAVAGGRVLPQRPIIRYYEWLSRDRHMAGKDGEVNWNEGPHSRVRDSLKRLQRRTKGYTKSVAMLRNSIALVCLRLDLF